MSCSVYTLPARERIKSRDALDRLFSEGKGGVVYPLRYMVLAEEAGGVGEPSEPADPGFRIMVSVPKRNHKRAVKRKVLKRRMREAFRLNKLPLADFTAAHNKNVHIGIIYISKDIHDFREISDAVRKIISKITGNG